MNSLVRKQVVDFVEVNYLFTQSQWGFRSGSSALSQLILVKSGQVNRFNTRACADAIYTNLSKAFDSISYDKLLLNA